VRAPPGRVSMATTMTPPRPRRLTRAVFASALVVPAMLAGWWLWKRPERATSHFDDALDRALLPVIEQSGAQHKLGAPTPALTRVLARELAESSVVYLAPRDLELWADIRARAARSSPLVCARLWKGGDQGFMGPAIAGLGDATLNAYAEMLARGLALRLERKPAPEPSPQAVERGFSAIAAALPQAAERAFNADAKRPDVSDTRACELFLTLSHGAAELEPAMRVDFYRALARELRRE
jgi:hypothetical protein